MDRLDWDLVIGVSVILSIGLFAMVIIGFVQQIVNGGSSLKHRLLRWWKMPHIRARIIHLLDDGVTAFGISDYYSIPIWGGVETEVSWRRKGERTETLPWHGSRDEFLELVSDHAKATTTIHFYNRGDPRGRKVITPQG